MQQESGEPGPGPGRTSLARYKSAPATWLEALLEDEVDDENDLLKHHHHHHNQSLTQLLASDTAPKTSADFPTSAADPSSVFYDAAGTSSSGFARQNSSPAEFLGSGDDVDGYFSSYGGGGGGASFGYLGGSDGGGTIGRDASALKYSSHLKVEQGARLPSRMSSMPEPDMDKLLEDSVPFRVRAKRGCATHPRSIAERVRRTKISDRIRKLQELVPNMDKQTNTADMLDEAVEYVKYLQKQIQELNEQQKKCKCTIKD